MREAQLADDLAILQLQEWAPTRMNHLYMANHAILRRLPSVVHGLLAIVEERDCHQARGFLSTATNIKTVYQIYLLDIIGDELTKLTKHFDADGALICEVYHYTQGVRATLIRARDNRTPKEKEYYRAVNQESTLIRAHSRFRMRKN